MSFKVIEMVFDNCPLDFNSLNSQTNNENNLALTIAKANGKKKYFIF